jgi:hypothetical protein
MIVLKRFSQEADLSNPEAFQFFLVFDKNGKELRLPVPQETINALIQEIYVAPVQREQVDAKDAAPEPYPEEATEFDGEDFPPGDAYDNDFAPESLTYDQTEIEGPESEEDVPSL